MSPTPPSTAAQISALVGATLEGDGSTPIQGPAGLREAGPRDVSFLANPRYAALLHSTRAGAVVLAMDVAFARDGVAVLRHADPNRAFTQIIKAFSRPEPVPAAGIHPRAAVDPAARIGPDVAVGPGCVVEAGAELAAGVILRAQVFVGRDARIGARSYLHPGCVVGHGVVIGADCLLHPGVVLGSDGFGFEPHPQFKEQGWVKVPQCGTVVVEDDVEIGANCTVDRARFGATRIGRGSKLDNLVHVAHNVVLEPRVLLVAQVGVAGSARIGSAAIIAGQAGVGGHVNIVSGVRVGAQSGVNHDLNVPGDYFGTPVRPLREAARDQGASRRIEAMRQQIAAIKERLDALECEGDPAP